MLRKALGCNGLWLVVWNSLWQKIKQEPPGALTARQSVFNIYGKSLLVWNLRFIREKRQNSRNHHAPSLRDSGRNIGCANPTLKRGTCDHCAYGAGDWLLSGTKRHHTGPFEGPATIKSPVWLEDTYSSFFSLRAFTLNQIGVPEKPKASRI